MRRDPDGFAKSVASCSPRPATWLKAGHWRRSPNSTSLLMTGSKAPKFNAKKNPATAGVATASVMAIGAVSGLLSPRVARTPSPAKTKIIRHTTWTKMSMRTLASARLPPRTPILVMSLAPMMSPPTRATGNSEFIASRINRTPTKGSGGQATAGLSRSHHPMPAAASATVLTRMTNTAPHPGAGHGLADGGEPVISRQTGEKRQAEQRGERSEELHRASIAVFDRGTARGEARRRMLLNPLRIFIDPNLPDVTSKCRGQQPH